MEEEEEEERVLVVDRIRGSLEEEEEETVLAVDIIGIPTTSSPYTSTSDFQFTPALLSVFT